MTPPLAKAVVKLLRTGCGTRLAEVFADFVRLGDQLVTICRVTGGRSVVPPFQYQQQRAG